MQNSKIYSLDGRYVAEAITLELTGEPDHKCPARRSSCPNIRTGRRDRNYVTPGHGDGEYIAVYDVHGFLLDYCATEAEVAMYFGTVTERI